MFSHKNKICVPTNQLEQVHQLLLLWYQADCSTFIVWIFFYACSLQKLFHKLEHFTQKFYEKLYLTGETEDSDFRMHA